MERQAARTEAVPVLRATAKCSMAKNKPEGAVRHAGMLGRKATRTATRYTGVRGRMERAPKQQAVN